MVPIELDIRQEMAAGLRPPEQQTEGNTQEPVTLLTPVPANLRRHMLRGNCKMYLQARQGLMLRR
jgi:hypothetical protein